MIRFLRELWCGALLPVDVRLPHDGGEAWVAFQQRAKAMKENARLRHEAVRPIEAAQQSLVHDALKRIVPTARDAGGCSRQVAS